VGLGARCEEGRHGFVIVEKKRKEAREAKESWNENVEDWRAAGAHRSSENEYTRAIMRQWSDLRKLVDVRSSVIKGRREGEMERVLMFIF
jgi:hypothetical protein